MAKVVPKAIGTQTLNPGALVALELLLFICAVTVT